MKVSVHFAVPRLPEGRFAVELVRRAVDGSYDGTVVSTAGTKENWISVKDAVAVGKEMGLSLSRKSLVRLGYAGEIRIFRPLTTVWRIEENSLRTYAARVKGDLNYWEGRPNPPENFQDSRLAQEGKKP